MSEFTRILCGTILALGVIFGVGYARADEVPTPRITLKEDGGGKLTDYIQALTYYKENNIAIKLDGMCASACTLITSTHLNLDYCVTEKAKLGIHHPFAIGPDGNIVYTIPAISQANQIWSEVFLGGYPEWLVKFIGDKGGAPDIYQGATPSDMLEVPYDELKKHVQICS